MAVIGLRGHAGARGRVGLAGAGRVERPALRARAREHAGARERERRQSQGMSQTPPRGRKRERRLGRVDLPTIVGALLDRHVPPELQRLTRVRALWLELMPRNVVEHVWPMLVQGERLIVHVQDSQWLHEMTYWRQDLLERLLGGWPEAEIERIDAFVGELPPLAQRRPAQPNREPSPIHPPVLSPEVPAETIDALNQIRDPRLRDALARARWQLGASR